VTERLNFVHILNKESIGGAESLVKSLVDYDQSNTHNILYIANNKISRRVLSISRIRHLIIFFSAVRLGKEIVLATYFKKQKIYIFHLAECHLLFYFIQFIFPLKKIQSVFVCYIHQSPKLYPAKLLRFTKSWSKKSDGIIFYSKVVEDSWSPHLTKIQNGSRNVVHNFVSNLYIKRPQNKEDLSSLNKIEIVFVGRFTSWKRPEMAAQIASQIAQKGVKVNLNYIGIPGAKSSSFKKYLSKENLNLVFHGLVTNGVDLLNKMDLMVYPADQDLCIEGVGVAAMEALVLGVPVVISNKKSTDFSELSSIIDFRELEYAIKLYDKDQFIYYISQLKMRANQNISIAKHNFSIDNYVNNLVHIALSIRECKKI
jgi:glycosyltransferase involved in cell wall biosynthesis